MAQQKKKWVAFRTNATIPADVVGEKEDKKVNVGEPVHLPAAYADHVVHDRFADPCEAPKKKAGPKKSGAGEGDAEKAAAQKAADQAAALKLAEAQTAVKDAELHLAAVAGTADEDAARDALEVAQKALAELQPAA